MRSSPFPTMLIFFGVSLLHAHWALGGRWGRDLAVPEFEYKPAFKPGRGATFVVAFLLFGAGTVVGLNADLLTWWRVPRWMASGAEWLLSVVMFLRFIGNFHYVGVFNRVRGTRFAQVDTLVYAPLCLALGVGCATVALLRPA